MAFTPFPIEVLESIIDLLATEDDAFFSSVKSCSLVSRSLLPRTRRHIFKVIAINLKQVTDTHGIPTHTTPRFVRLISQSPDIARHVGTLVYFVMKEDSHVEGLAVALSSLTNLWCLRLVGQPRTNYHMPWVEFPCLETILRLMHLPTLSHLKLCTIGSFALSSLALCSGLKCLGMDSLFDTQVGNIELCEPPPCLTTLAVFVDDDKEFLGKLCTTRADGKPIIDISRLQKLTISAKLTPMQPRDTVEFFRSCTQLVDVTLTSCQSLLPNIGFAELFRPSIRTLQHIHVQFSLFETDEDPLTQSVASEFALLTGNNIIESIKISVYIWLPDDLESYNHEGLWSPLDEVFTQSQSDWPKLQKVSLNIKIGVEEWSYTNTEDYLDFLHDLHWLPNSQMAGLRKSDNIIFDFSVSP